MKAIIITIGDEILMGQILDTNSQYIARSLTDMGVEITEILSIPDKRDEIYETDMIGWPSKRLAVNPCR